MALKNPSYTTQSRELLDDFDELAGLGDEQNGGGGGERNAYLVEHLATFTVTRETGILYPADGMRRLLQLEKSNGIWSQKMQLCLDGPWVLIMDYETGSIMERFPATLIQEPTAFTSSDPVELYNNILAFIVAPPNERGRSPSPRREMHIFQCHNINAQDLVEDLKLLKGGGSGGRLSHLESVSDAAGRDFAIERERMRESNDGEKPRRAQMAHLSHYRERDRGSDSEAAGAGQEDEVSSTSSDRLYEQDIAILNRCFDDIEKFIARLQHAAAASRELERRRRSRKTKSKSSDSAGEGMLALRTRPPPERDFRDVLQKFKLSFNLLARLRAHIHDPNAPELVHFLFTPLALIVDASHDASPDGKLAARVVQPLLTREALNLLANCVTSKETELWHSLGDAWLIPREQWKGSVPPYQPVFMDGWTPDYTVEDQALQRTSPRRTDVPPSSYHQPYIPEDQDAYGDQYGGPPYARNNKAQRNSADSESVGSSPEREIPSRRAPPPVQMHLQNKDMSLDSVDQGGVLGDDERESGSLNGWIRSAQARGARLVTVTYPRTANNDKELTVHRGEILEVLDDTRKWWKARNRQGMTAHVPHTIVAPYQPSAANAPQADVFNNPVYAPHYQDNAPRRSDAGSPLSGTGSYDSESTEINSPLSNSPMVFENGPFGKVSSELEVKSALAPPPPPPPHSPLWKTLPSAGKNGMSTGKSVRSLGLDDMQQELKMVLSMYNEKKKKIDIKKTPDLFIQQSSTEPEVQNWLEVKGFDEAVRNKLLPLNGAKLFALNKIQLQALVGRQDGKRLYSQILVQRNVSGYKTTTSSELNSILKKVREKVEVQS